MYLFHYIVVFRGFHSTVLTSNFGMPIQASSVVPPARSQGSTNYIGGTISCPVKVTIIYWAVLL